VGGGGDEPLLGQGRMIARDFCGLLLKPCMNSQTGKTAWATGALAAKDMPALAAPAVLRLGKPRRCMVMMTPGGGCGAPLGRVPGRAIGDAAAVTLTEMVGEWPRGVSGRRIAHGEDVPVLPVAATVAVMKVAWSCELRHDEPLNTGRPVARSWRKPFATHPPAHLTGRREFRGSVAEVHLLPLVVRRRFWERSHGVSQQSESRSGADLSIIGAQLCCLRRAFDRSQGGRRCVLSPRPARSRSRRSVVSRGRCPHSCRRSYGP
jgi:hypothetical protein